MHPCAAVKTPDEISDQGTTNCWDISFLAEVCRCYLWSLADRVQPRLTLGDFRLNNS